MRAISDMGGQREHYGPIVREANEPVFHERWEGRVYGLASFVLLACRANAERFRFAMEQLPREQYLAGYYQRWLAAFERMLIDAGHLRAGGIDARLDGLDRPQRAAHPRASARTAVVARVIRSGLRRRFSPWVAKHVLPRLTGTTRRARATPRFATGDHVQVRALPERAFTRKPGYVIGKPGVVTAHHGTALFADARGEGRRARPQHLYTVAFDGRALWGDAAEAATEVRVDLFESHLEPA